MSCKLSWCWLITRTVCWSTRKYVFFVCLLYFWSDLVFCFFVFGCQCEYNRLPGRTCLQYHCVSSGTLSLTFTVSLRTPSQHWDSTCLSAVGHICCCRSTAGNTTWAAWSECGIRLCRPWRSATANTHKVWHHENGTQLDHIIPARLYTASLLQTVFVWHLIPTLWHSTVVCSRPNPVAIVRVWTVWRCQWIWIPQPCMCQRYSTIHQHASSFTFGCDRGLHLLHWTSSQLDGQKSSEAEQGQDADHVARHTTTT